MEARGIGLNPHAERGTWNVGSVSFAGTTRRGKTTRSAPKIPNWEQSGGGDGGGARRNSSDEAEFSDFDEAMLALDDVQIGHHLDKARRRTRGESQAGLLAGEDDDGEYSTSVIRRGLNLDSTITVKGFTATHELRNMGHNRLASSTSSLPSLSASWVRQAEDTLPITPALDGHPTLRGATSYLTAQTTTLSIAGATISHSSDDSDEDERDDVFQSTLMQSPLSPFTPALHRFSLIKPGFQRFLGSLGAIPALTDPAVAGARRSSTDLKRGASAERVKRGSAGEDGLFGAGAKCELCDKRLGMLKGPLIFLSLARRVPRLILGPPCLQLSSSATTADSGATSSARFVCVISV